MDDVRELLKTHDHYDNYMRGKYGFLENGDVIEYFDDYVLINNEHYSKFVDCPICSKKYRRITNTHLWTVHQITAEEFTERYPEFSIASKFNAYLNGYKLKNKTYEEIYGHDKAKILRKTRIDDAFDQFKDQEQKSIRSIKLKGRNITCEAIEKTIETKFGDLFEIGYKEKALSYYGEQCQWCGTENDITVHHIDENNYGNDNVFTNNQIDNLSVLCRSCHAKLHNFKRPGFFSGKTKIEKGFALILDGLFDAYGLNKVDENFRESPSRVARSYLEMLQGIDPSEAENILAKNFPTEGFDQMVVVSNIQCYSMCPHHFLPIRYKIDFGYFPDKHVLGLSKIPRFIKLMAQAPLMQETLTQRIINKFDEYVQPLGCIVLLSGIHMCMCARGIEMDEASTETIALSGVFKTERSIKQEFYNILNQKKK